MVKPTSYEHFVSLHPKWTEAIELLNSCLLKLGFEVAIKWNMPVYLVEGMSFVSIGAFKNHFSLRFFRGDLLCDSASLLVNAQPGKTKEMRYIKWTSSDDVDVEIINSNLEKIKTNL